MSLNSINQRALSVLIMSLTLLFAACGNKTPFQRAGILEGASNFRDLGDYPSENGKRTAVRKVFRSEKLSELSDRDLETIKALGIKTVIDFRGDDEVLKEPSRLPEGVNVVRLPIGVGNNNNDKDSLNIMEQLTSGKLDSLQCVEWMQSVNRRFAVEFTSQYRDFFSLLMQPDSYPVVFHCTAGKDRTGFAAAMLLSALGVDWDNVMSDYLLTNQCLKPQKFMSQMPEQAMPALRQVWGVQPSYLNAAREEIIKRYGSIDNYLQEELKIGESEKGKLRQYLLE